MAGHRVRPGPNLGLGTSNPWPSLVTGVSCGRSHIAEVFFADMAYWPGSYPGDTAITPAADAECGRAFTGSVRGSRR